MKPMSLLGNEKKKGLSDSVKNILAVTCGICIAAVSFSGCTDRSNILDESSTVPESSVSQVTEEEAAENNALIGETNVDLVQLKAGTNPNAEIAVMKTSMGDVTIELYRDKAPLAVDNFVTLANSGYYNGIIFHRVIDNFMIQGGDPTGTGRGGQSIYEDEQGNPVPFKDEFSLDLWNFRGALSMANSGANTNGSQFFIVQTSFVTDDIVEAMKKQNFPETVIAHYQEVGGTPHLDWKHTVFGQVIDGMDIVDAIAGVDVDNASKPVEDVVIHSITVTGSPEPDSLEEPAESAAE